MTPGARQLFTTKMTVPDCYSPSSKSSSKAAAGAALFFGLTLGLVAIIAIVLIISKRARDL
jgi:nitrate reductase gamma subunit